MLLTVTRASLEGIFAPILGIGMAFLVVMISVYMISFLSKIFGVGVKTRGGQIIATPTTFDEINEMMSAEGKKIINRLKSNFASSHKKITSSSVSKVDKLLELQRLLNEGIITKGELEILKKEII